MEFPRRKPQRLEDYDYSQNSAYYITICTHNRLHLFGDISEGYLLLNDAGRMVRDRFEEMSRFYPGIVIDNYVLMPNHLHTILIIRRGGTAQGPLPTTNAPKTVESSFSGMTLSDYIHRFKTLTTKLYIDGVKKGSYPPFSKRVWQKSYYDHIIRYNHEYLQIWRYIDENPLKWMEDCYYVQNENLGRS